MLPSWLIVDRLDRELRALRSLERDAEGRAGGLRGREVSGAHRAVAGAAQAVAEAANDVEGDAAHVAWRSLTRARDEVAWALRPMKRRRRDGAPGATWGTGPRPG